MGINSAVVGTHCSWSGQGEDTSLLGAFITAATLIGLNYLLDHIAFKSPLAEKILEGEEKLLIRDGKVLESVRQKEEITLGEISSCVREHGLTNIEDVAIGILENNGKISIIPKKTNQSSETTL